MAIQTLPDRESAVFSPMPPGTLAISTSNPYAALATGGGLPELRPRVFTPYPGNTEATASPRTRNYNPADENRGRVSYSTPEREAEVMRLMAQVRLIKSIAEVRPMFRRILELEDEELIDRRRRERERAIAEVDALGGYRVQTPLPVCPQEELSTTRNLTSPSRFGRQPDLSWDEEDSLDFGEPAPGDIPGGDVLALCWSIHAARRPAPEDSDWFSDETDSEAEMSEAESNWRRAPRNSR